MQGNQATASGVLPTFVVIGAMRCGTTSLVTYLREHPDVYVCRPKEPHFFDTHWHRGLDWYRSLYSGWSGQHAIGEATPAYMYDRAALDRMAAALPDVKTVAILRNPVDRAYSHYWHRRARGIEPLTFEEALAAEPARLARGDRRARMDYSYVDRGRYLSQLQYVVELFGRNRVQILLLDHLQSRPQQTFAALCRFLDVYDRFEPPSLGKTANSHVGFRSLPLRSLSRLMPRPARQIVGRLNVRVERYPPMDPSVRASLVEQYREENWKLSRWLGVDLSAWEL